MEPKVRTFLAPKRGEALEDCEDSIYPMPGEHPKSGKGDRAFAVSDGTTTSFMSGPWARILVQRFAENPAAVFEMSWADWLQDSQQKWKDDVRQRSEAKDASFYTRNEVLSRKPAAATFVGLILAERETDGRIPWRALVLGDSCLFLLRKDGPRSMDLTRSEEFSNIVKTAESYVRGAVYEPRKLASGSEGEAELRDGDSILLATDALSKWLLKREERGMPVWGTVLSLESQEEFVKLVDDARREADSPLENDDVSLAVITIGTPHEQYLRSRFAPKPGEEKPDAAPRRAPSAYLPSNAGLAGSVPMVTLTQSGARPRITQIPEKLQFLIDRIRSKSGWLGAALLAGILITLCLSILFLQRDIAAKSEANVQLNKEFGLSEKERREQSREIEEKNVEINHLREVKNLMEDRLNQFKQGFSDGVSKGVSEGISQGLQKSSKERDALNAEIAALQKEKRDVNDKLAARSHELDDAKVQKASQAVKTKAEASKADMEIQRLTGDNQILGKKGRELQSDNERLGKESEGLRKDNERLRKMGMQMEQEIKELKAAPAALPPPAAPSIPGEEAPEFGSERDVPVGSGATGRRRLETVQSIRLP